MRSASSSRDGARGFPGVAARFKCHRQIAVAARTQRLRRHQLPLHGNFGDPWRQKLGRDQALTTCDRRARGSPRVPSGCAARGRCRESRAQKQLARLTMELEFFPIRSPNSPRKCSAKSTNVVTTVAQRWNLDRKHRAAGDTSRAEISFRDKLRQIAMRRRNHAGFELTGRTLPTRLERAFFRARAAACLAAPVPCRRSRRAARFRGPPLRADQA